MFEEYAYRLYEYKDCPGIFSLMGKFWGEQVARRTEQLWDWKIERNPCNPPEGPRSHLAFYGNKVIAIMATIPMRFKFREQEQTFLWVVDYLADPSYKTVGWRIFNRLYKESYTLIGTPNETSYTIGIAAKWFEICNFYNYFHFIRPEKVLNGKIRNRLALGVLGRVWQGVRVAAKCVQPRIPAGLVCTEVGGFGEDFDELWRTVSGGYEAIGVRSSRFLNWKYREMPGGNFRIFLARRENRPAGYIITQIKESQGQVRGEIVDFLTAVDDMAALAALFRKATEELTAGGADLISCFMLPYTRRHARLLGRFGFWFRKKRYPCIAYQTKTSSLTKAELRSTQWFLNGGDSDLSMS